MCGFTFLIVFDEHKTNFDAEKERKVHRSSLWLEDTIVRRARILYLHSPFVQSIQILTDKMRRFYMVGNFQQKLRGPLNGNNCY